MRRYNSTLFEADILYLLLYCPIIHQALIPNFISVSDIVAPKLHLIGVNWHPDDELLDHFN